MTAIEAIDDTVANVPDTFRLYHFLKAHRAEVNGMLMGEYDEKKVMNQFKEEGRAEGLKEGQLMTLLSLVEDGDITPEKAAQKAGISLEAFQHAMEKHQAEYSSKT